MAANVAAASRADLVIDRDGSVVKEGIDYVDRKATDQELREAELV
jgi:hypothetical protein